MEGGRVAYWLQIGANVGILAGILLVWVQIDQNTELVRYQLFNDRMSDYLDAEISRMGETPHATLARVVESPESMTYDDFIVLDAMLSRYLDHHLRNKRLQDEGLYDEGEEHRWRAHFDWVIDGKTSPFGLYFGNPVAKAWWAEAGFWWDEEFDRAVDEAIAATSDDDSRKMYLGIMERVRERSDQ